MLAVTLKEAMAPMLVTLSTSTMMAAPPRFALNPLVPPTADADVPSEATPAVPVPLNITTAPTPAAEAADAPLTE